MKAIHHFLIVLCIFLAANTYSQTTVEDLPHFDKVVASPYINVKLVKGDEEKIVIEATNVELEKINVEVNRGTLKIYLDGARLWPKNEKTKIEGEKYKQEKYKDVSIYATITYQDLKAIKIRGEGEVNCSDKLGNEKFKLSTIGETKVSLDFILAEKLRIRSIGENEIKIASGNAEKVKTKMIGENELTMNSGKVDNVKTKLIGENAVNLENVLIDYTKYSAIGENNLDCNSKELLKVIFIGESHITQFGKAKIRKMGIGENDYHYAYKE